LARLYATNHEASRTARMATTEPAIESTDPITLRWARAQTFVPMSQPMASPRAASAIRVISASAAWPNGESASFATRGATTAPTSRRCAPDRLRSVVTIAHISDPHVGSPYFVPNLMNRVIVELNDLDPDIIVNTGDLTNEGYRQEYKGWCAYRDRIRAPMVTV